MIKQIKFIIRVLTGKHSEEQLKKLERLEELMKITEKKLNQLLNTIDYEGNNSRNGQ